MRSGDDGGLSLGGASVTSATLSFRFPSRLAVLAPVDERGCLRGGLVRVRFENFALGVGVVYSECKVFGVNKAGSRLAIHIAKL